MELPVGKTMPYNIEAEQAVLGSMIFDEAALNKCMELLNKDDFYTSAHQRIFEAMDELFSKGVPVDIVTLSNALGNDLDKVGGISYISSIVQNVISTENLAHYIAIAKEKGLLRKLVNAAGSIIDMSTKDEEDASIILDKSEQLIYNISEKRSTKDFYHISEIVKSAMALMEELKKRGSSITGVPTGFTELDTLTAGLQKGTVTIIAARPGVGKTSFALNIAENASIRHGVPVAIFSLEMGKEELVNKVLSSEALVPLGKMRIGDLSAAEMTKLAHSLHGVINAPIYIDDTSNISVGDIMSKCRRLKTEKNIGLVVIDYLQLMQTSGKSDNRANEVGEISRTLKIMSKELEIPIIALSQLNRSSEKRTDKRPQISDLRESGNIEQDADIVMLLHSPDNENEGDPMARGNITECIVAKNRAGEQRTIKLAWRGEYTKFMNLDNRN